MNTKLILLSATIGLFLYPCNGQNFDKALYPKPVIQSNQPATNWKDAFLSGNGLLGAMVFGNPLYDTIIFNHHQYVCPDGGPQPTLLSCYNHRL